MLSSSHNNVIISYYLLYCFNVFDAVVPLALPRAKIGRIST